jgi:hypothetical protein
MESHKLLQNERGSDVREGLEEFFFWGTCIKLGMCTIKPENGEGYLGMSQTC